MKSLVEILSINSLQTGYHVNNINQHESILKQGFYLGKVRKRIYFWGDYAMANWFAHYQNDYKEIMMIYKVDLSGLKLIKDPETNDMSKWSNEFEAGYDGDGWYAEVPIKPERIEDFKKSTEGEF